MSASIRAAHKAKGHGRQRKGKFEYKAPKLRPNTGTQFYTYVLLDPRKPGTYRYGRWKFDYEPFYVGKGKGGRAFDHLREFDVERSPNKHKKNKIRAIFNAGLEPIIKIQKHDIDEATAFELEAKLIHTIGCGKLGPLTNFTNSCDGRAGYKHTAQTREKLSALSKSVWNRSTEQEKEARCTSISQAKGCMSLAEYKQRLKSLPSGRITVVVDGAFRMTHRLLHRCKCGNEWYVAPTHLLRVNVGCVKCRRRDPELVEHRRIATAQSKAQRNLPQYKQLLKETYGTSIKLVDGQEFQMTKPMIHSCSSGHTWSIQPKLFKRYRNGCPYCKTHTRRTAKSVLLNIGHI